MIIELKKVSGTRLSQHDAAMNETFCILQFILKARSSDPVREILHYLLIEESGEEKTLVCTDGRRLHYREGVKGLSFKAGFYRVLKATPQVIWLDLMEDSVTYPKWRQVIPKSGETVVLNIEEKTEHYRLCVEVHKASKGGFFNLAYLLDAMPPFETRCELKITATDEVSPVLIENKYGKCVLMPMRG